MLKNNKLRGFRSHSTEKSSNYTIANESQDIGRGDNDLKKEIRKPLYPTSLVVERALSSKTNLNETGFCPTMTFTETQVNNLDIFF